MISAETYVRVEFDDDGKRKITEAYTTLTKIITALKKVGGQTSQMEDELEQVTGYLQAILDGGVW